MKLRLITAIVIFLSLLSCSSPTETSTDNPNTGMDHLMEVKAVAKANKEFVTVNGSTLNHKYVTEIYTSDSIASVDIQIEFNGSMCTTSDSIHFNTEFYLYDYLYVEAIGDSKYNIVTVTNGAIEFVRAIDLKITTAKWVIIPK